jgi:hypothetical protein
MSRAILSLAAVLSLLLVRGAPAQVDATKGVTVALPMTAACGPELQKHCAGIQPGGGRLLKCLDARRSDLSQSCASYVRHALNGCGPEPGYDVRCIVPSDTDPTIKRFNRQNYVLVSEHLTPSADLLVFLTGTSGVPPGPIGFLRAAVDAGYRVISLDYNDEPAVAVFCPRRPPACSGNFRRMRIYGDGTYVDPSINNTSAESIVSRLVKLLVYLDKENPREGWGAYVDGGAPNWSRIAFAGQSQGAGMTAYIAKQHVIARAILFSSPWDFVVTGGTRSLAPWIATPGKTPPERWFGGYHARENEAGLLAKSFAALRIPPENIRVFNGPLSPAARAGNSNNPYHGEGLTNLSYAQDRAFFLGRSP